LREETLPSRVEKTEQQEQNEEVEENKQQNTVFDIEQITSSIDNVVGEITELKGFQSIINELEKKKYRLENRELTIALFGTFSAGKSSFSNALFGERVLPVSPNPTTAVISRISPVTSQHSHGTVNIT